MGKTLPLLSITYLPWIIIGYIFFNHGTSIHISNMFAISQFVLFTMMFGSLFVARPKNLEKDNN